MKTLLITAALLLLSGCAATSTASRSTDGQSDAEAQFRDRYITARVAEHQKRGLSNRDARALAESEFEGSLAPQRRAAAHVRTTPQ